MAHLSKSDISRQALLEVLEPRLLLSGAAMPAAPPVDPLLIVSTIVDESDGDYGPGDLSLREALALAAGSPADDTIEFHDSLFGGTILLDAGLGELVIDSNVNVVGPGAGLLTVDADDNCRVFHVGSGAIASISGLTITGGWAEDPAGGPNAAGGAVYNIGTLTLTESVISESYAGGGGGVCNFGTAMLTNVTVTGNSARGGGGIANYHPGVMTITDSLIIANTLNGGISNNGDLTLQRVTVADNEGGGISNQGPLTITNSTISGNTTTDGGGGIQNYRHAITVTKTTISGNSAGWYGGGIYLNSGSALLVNSTVTNNRTRTDGGGIFLYEDHDPVVTIYNTIVARNFLDPHGVRNDIAGAIDPASSHNLIGSAAGANSLGPLSDNGGPTLTHPLLPGSSALDAGSNARAEDLGLTTDQRGFDRFSDSDGDGVITVDIGAYEYQGPRTFYVDDDAPNDPGHGTPEVSDPLEDGTVAHPFDAIQEAIAATQFGDIVMVLDGAYTGYGNRDIKFLGKAITVRSQNGPDNCTIDVQGSELDPHRGFDFASRETADSVLEGFTITGGYVTGDWSTQNGGAIRCRQLASPTIRGNVITGNRAVQGAGGGIYCAADTIVSENVITDNTARYGAGVYSRGHAVITHNTITDNTATDDGGGVTCHEWNTVAYNVISRNTAAWGGGIWTWEDYPATIIGNVISENWAEEGGGGIGVSWDYLTVIAGNLIVNNATNGTGGAIYLASDSSLIINNTIVGNTAANGVGGIVNRYWEAKVVNCILWDNGDDLSGATPTYSCIEDDDPGEGNTHANPLFVDPAGGDYRLLPGSPCINGGDNSAIPADLTTDIAGDPRIIGGIVDVGAYESASSVVLHVPGQTEFDGQGDYLEFKDRPNLNVNEYSIAFWFLADAPDNGTQTLIARGEDWARDKAQWVIELNDARNRGKIQLWYEQANDRDHYFATETTIEAGVWYHFAVTRSSAGEVTVYLDGQAELQVIETAAPASVETSVTLGARRNSPNRIQDYFDGTIGETLVYDTVLDSAEIVAVMDQTAPSGCWSSERITVSPEGQSADVAMNADGSFVVVWQAGNTGAGIYAQQFDASGDEAGAEILVSSGVSGTHQYPAVTAGPEGGFVVVWEDTAVATGPDVLARRFDADGDPLGGAFVVNYATAGDQMRPDIATDAEGNFAIAWGGEDIFVQRFDAGGGRLGVELLINTEEQGYRGDPEIAMNASGDFVVCYKLDEWVNSQWVTYDSQGHRVASAQVDSTYETGLAINDEGFFVFSSIDYDTGVLAQVYTHGGIAVGDRIIVTPGKHGGLDWNIYDSDVKMDNESFVITWRDYYFPDEGSGHSDGIYAARFGLPGERIGDEIKVSIGEAFWERDPSVGIGDNGRFAIAWQRGWGDSSVFARAFRCAPDEAVEPADPLLHLPDRMEFDGADDYLAIEDPALDISSYSIAFWFQADDPSGSIQSLVARGEDFAGDKAQWIVQLNAEENPGKMQLWYEDIGGADSVFATSSDIVPDNWYHFAVTRTPGGEVRIYLDGVLELVQPDPTPPASIDSPVYIGARGNSGDRIQEFFDGRMEEVSVYGEVLSAWELNRLLADTAPDTGFRGLVYQHEGEIELDGQNDYLLIDDSDLLNTNEYTIAFSFIADDPTGGTQSLVARGEDFAGDKAQWVIELNDRQNRGKLQLWYEEENDADHYFAAEPTIQADKWSHAVVSRSAEGRVVIYIDGVVSHESTDAAAPASVDTPILIGARRNSPNRVQDYFDGTIEDVRIYNVAMSHDEIIDIVPAPRLSINSPIDGEVYASTGIHMDVSFDRPLTDISYTFNGAGPYSMLVPGLLVQEDPDAVDIWSGSVARVTFDYNKPDWAVDAEYVITYEDASGVHTVSRDLSEWDRLPGYVRTRVYYRSDNTVTVDAYGHDGWYTLVDLGYNNPGGSGDDVTTLYDGNYSTGATYHRGARKWLTGGLAGSFVKIIEESVRWDIGLAEDAVRGTLVAQPGLNTLTVHGTDTLGKTSSESLTFTVAAPTLTNGDFETGSLGPWVLTDSGGVVTSDLFTPEIPPAGGSYMGYITTGRNELPSDLHFADLDGNGVGEREYSALSIDVFVSSAATVEVDLNFLTADILRGGGFGDSDLWGVTTGAITDTGAYKMLYAAAPTDGSYSGTATPLTAPDFSDEYIEDNPFGSYPTILDKSVFYGQTGFQRYSFPLDAGLHTLTFFVADSHTDGEATGMLIDNLTITP
ncbi:MAG: choice-of-anchor Q domain-containing protein [Phycisphaerae bacterium]|jgi:hypothetical protein|nr:choice-of-anchor Q domain-containing protein [Phycisphaerae bacterium]